MTTLTQDDAPQLLRLISGMGSYGIAEAEPRETFLARFLPLPEHARALDPSVVLVIGDRGAGKTELFRAIQFPSGLQAIVELSGGRQLPPPAQSRWLIGYSSTGTDYPPELVFRKFAERRVPADLQQVWLSLLLRCVVSSNVLRQESLPAALCSRVTAPALDLDTFHKSTGEHLVQAFSALDQLDSELGQRDEWVFVAYDELDRVSAGDWEVMRVILRGLVQFWSSYARRWRRIRPKIFLRRDLFERVALFGPDVSKIAAQRVELVWTERNLYLLVLKRLMNQGDLVQRHLAPLGLPGADVPDRGWCPSDVSEEKIRAFVERICGPVMGSGANKGRTYKWIPNHLQDGNGRVLPRSVVRLFESAADIELNHRRADWPRLLHHSSLRAAVDKVSVARVQELEGEEFPWLKTVRTTLEQARPEVPIERSRMERLLTINWQELADRPPETSGRDLLKLLMELGILYSRSTKERKVDVRDLYLKGFGLRRRGGVEQPH